MLDAYIYDGKRTPFGRHAGSLAKVRPDDLLAGVAVPVTEVDVPVAGGDRGPAPVPARIDHLQPSEVAQQHGAADVGHAAVEAEHEALAEGVLENGHHQHLVGDVRHGCGARGQLGWHDPRNGRLRVLTPVT